MAKTIKTNKGDALTMFVVLGKVPSSKLAADTARYLGARRAVKKAVKEYIDWELDHVKKIQEESNKISEALGKLGKDDADERNKLNAKRSDLVSKANKEFEKQKDLLKTQKVEIVFDNEDFLFTSNLIKSNAPSFFSEGEDKPFDAEAADVVFELLDSAT